ncbi:ParB/RepB/Spo0J family partition protein [Vibrio crassostreae]|uniref:ParB/Srx family N-terminal domain-containing protein n=1 Tax=Vibrio crassostreae TaxID=246167 RepID=UPI001045F53A|nr:ParB/Srx family N-terminal domain-containing protein [Vibrio crassostreae]CAH6850543.1 ParB/RepB/Spo0J family partition protein [Vibrio chagasii]TCT44314.1 ParB/RepB/Spo0J family partition protein [Vibrio crassostreae]CAH6861986.1 ParB/RepB/Spo0J family partition protein [Vibrio chagasii]CAH6926024.1 ParB/RepB/Spo0J family partition protein [Vibrio chagasii]CAH6945111.1 ParB/RepB/Spo0J family partition protein [Vibrio chagasii]
MTKDTNKEQNHDFYQYCVKSVRELSEYENNSRFHSDEQIEEIVNSIKTFGFTAPILIDENGEIIAGHARLRAATILEYSQVPCIVLSGLTESQKKAYVIADNQLALNSDWDIDALRAEIDHLKSTDFDISVLGFSDEYLDELLDIEIEFPSLPSGDRELYQQKTFTLHDEQASIIEDALQVAKKAPAIKTGLNENSNGNALTAICEQWLGRGA